MNRKVLLGMILAVTLIAIIIIFITTRRVSYKSLVISEKKWNDIVNKRTEDNNITLTNLKFNDYSLLIDEEDNIIYYSIVNSSSKYNPSVRYILNDGYKIVISSNMSDSVIDANEAIKVMIYNNNKYKIYSLIITNYPIINIKYKTSDENKINRIPVEIELFDNHVDSPQRLLRSKGRFSIIEVDKKYVFSLFKESPGHNKRENNVSIFGMDKEDEYILELPDEIVNGEKYVQFFINNKYIGVFELRGNSVREVRGIGERKEN